MSNSTKQILIGCEESQVICQSFISAGYLATKSCDLIPTRGNPNYHIQADIIDVIPSQHWDLIILHPPCTALSLSGNKHYGEGKPLNHKRHEALAWTLALWRLAIKHSNHAALENPMSILFKHIGYMFYLQPWQHGHGETKKTGFALHNLLPLQPSNIVAGRADRIHKMAPSKYRARDRSVTYQGVADAIVDQWGSQIDVVRFAK